MKERNSYGYWIERGRERLFWKGQYITGSWGDISISFPKCAQNLEKKVVAHQEIYNAVNILFGSNG